MLPTHRGSQIGGYNHSSLAPYTHRLDSFLEPGNHSVDPDPGFGRPVLLVTAVYSLPGLVVPCIVEYDLERKPRLETRNDRQDDVIRRPLFSESAWRQPGKRSLK